jgi:L-gulonolactone oxidase
VSTSEQPAGAGFEGADWREFVELLDFVRVGLQAPGPGPLWSRSSADPKRSLNYRWRNWARNQEAKPDGWPKPKSESEVSQEIARVPSGKHVRVLGRGYSFSPLVPTDDVLLDMTKMIDCQVDKTGKTVTAGPGTTIARLHRKLVRNGLCLPTAPVIPWITVGGAFGTGVHGTGRSQGSLADLVVQAQVVDASGKVHVVDGRSNEWRALGCNLGALGVITSVTFQAVELFNLKAKDDTQNYWLETTMLSRDELRRLLTEPEYVAALWWPGTERCWVKKWNRTNEEPTTSDVQYFLDQLGVRLGAGFVTRIGKLLCAHPTWTPIFTSLTFDAIEHQEHVSPAPDVFHFLTQYPMVWNMSYAFDVEGYADVGIDRVVNAWKALVAILEEHRRKGEFPQNMAVHMRHIQSSGSLLSPSTGHDGSVMLEIVTLQGGDSCRGWKGFFGEVEDAWLALGGRPHWGKVHGWGNAGGQPQNPNRLPEILASYPPANVAVFRALRQAWDPTGKFQNLYTTELGL